LSSARNEATLGDRVKLRPLFFPLAALALAGCATQPISAPLPSPGAGAAALSARSLQDAGLQAFLAENLGRAPAASAGTGPAAWDFETLSWVAFYYNPSLALARAQWATARAVRQTASARPNPTLSLIPGYNTTRQPGVSPWFPAINFDFLLQGDKRARREDIAAADAEAARLAVLAIAWQVRGELHGALLDLQAASVREQMVSAQARLQDQLAALVTQRVEAGRASSSEAAMVRMTALRLHKDLADASTQVVAARSRLAAALGVPVNALSGQEFAAPPVPPFSAEALAAAQREALLSRADVLSALAKVQSAHAALELETARQQPDLHLGPGYQWDQGANKWSLALTFELPIFHRNEGPIAEAVARRAEAVAQFNLVQARVIAAIDAAVAAQSASTRQVAAMRTLRTEAAAENARARQRLALGAADQLDRLNAALELGSVELALADAESAAALAAGQLADTLQLPFPRLAALADTAHPSLPRPP
jgi:outer membrane protein TolC